MKVLTVSDVFFPRVNGVSTSIDTFRKQLPQFDVHMDLLVPDYGSQAEAGCSAHEGIYRIPSRQIPRDPEDRLMSWRHAWQCWPKLQEAGYDLIHVQTPFLAHYLGTRLAIKLGIPVVGTYHTLFEEYLHHYLPFVPAAVMRSTARAFSRWQCNALEHVVVPSSAMSSRLKGYGVKTPMTVLPTGIPTQHFQQGEGTRFREKFGIAPTRPVLLFVGRVAHEKNIGFLLAMLQHLRQDVPDVLLIVTGEGPARGALETQTQKLGLERHVLFLGYLDRKTDLLDAYAGANVFAFASQTETQGLVLLEAMAAGLPVVALAEMGTIDILAPEQGARVAPNDPAGFAYLVGAILRDPGLQQSMAGDAKAYAESWSDRMMAQRLAVLYQEIVDARKSI